MTSDKTKCIICNGKCLYVNTFYDDRYGYPGRFEMVRCQECYHAFLQCDFSTEQLIELYSKYYPRSSLKIENFSPRLQVKGWAAWFNGEYRSAYCLVPKNVRVLDIGCGFGETIAYHQSRGCDAYGVEADENIRRVIDEYGFKIEVGLFNPELYGAAFFDYVTMDQVIEHVTDALETLRSVAKVLKPGGIAVLSTPNANGWGAKVFGRRWINWHAPYHIQFFSRKSLQIAAEKAGLKVKKVKTITSSEWLLYQWIHLLTYPQISVPSAFWGTRKERCFRLKLLLKLLSYMHRTKINHCITRLFDALGLGDNYLLILEKQ